MDYKDKHFLGKTLTKHEYTETPGQCRFLTITNPKTTKTYPEPNSA